jgi:hypothetical protein
VCSLFHHKPPESNSKHVSSFCPLDLPRPANRSITPLPSRSRGRDVKLPEHRDDATRSAASPPHENVATSLFRGAMPSHRSAAPSQLRGSASSPNHRPPSLRFLHVLGLRAADLQAPCPKVSTQPSPFSLAYQLLGKMPEPRGDAVAAVYLCLWSRPSCCVHLLQVSASWHCRSRCCSQVPITGRTHTRCSTECPIKPLTTKPFSLLPSTCLS